jgi:hypothetical protein
MQWEKSPSGLFVVKFNNVTIPCDKDTDCEVVGRALCHTVNQTQVGIQAYWTSINQCVCPTFYGWEGDQCQLLNSSAALVVAIFILTIILSAFGILISVVDIVQIRLYRLPLKLDPLLITAVSTVIGLAGVIIAVSTFLAEYLGSTLREDPSRSGRKLIGRPDISDPAMAIMFLFLSLGSLNVSAVWVDVANATSSMQSRYKMHLIRYKKGLFLFETLFVTGIVIGAALQRVDTSAIFGLVAVVVICITYLYGYYRLSAVINGIGLNSSSTLEKSEPSNDQIAKVRDVLNTIRKTCLLVVSANLLSGALLLTFILRGAFVLVPTPEQSPSETRVLMPFLWLSFSLLGWAVVSYVHAPCLFEKNTISKALHNYQDQWKQSRKQQ